MLKIVDNRRQYLSEHPEMSRIFGFRKGVRSALDSSPTYRVLMISQEQT